ncbi:MAG: ThuA domain-containing protein [Pirellula sp.]|nr:ThuA domain-containing protein [Pirellula sp.]
MKRREFLQAAAAAAFASSLLGASRSFAAAPFRKVLFFTKSAGFQHSAIKREKEGDLGFAERTLIDLGKQHGFEVTATKDGSVFDGDLDQYDAYFFYTTGDLTQPGNDKNPPMSKEGKQKLFDAVAGGKGFLASHCGSDTFHSKGPSREEQKPEDIDPYIKMLGGEFISHGPQQKGRMIVKSPTFPGLSGVGDSFEIHDEWYSLRNFAPDLQVILLQDTQGMTGEDYERPPYPATWARQHGKGRVFYTSMGHREDVWTNPTFQQILLGGLNWAVGNVEFAVAPNLEQAAPGARIMPPPKKPKPDVKPKKPAAKPAA